MEDRRQGDPKRGRRKHRRYDAQKNEGCQTLRPPEVNGRAADPTSQKGRQQDLEQIDARYDQHAGERKAPRHIGRKAQNHAGRQHQDRGPPMKLEQSRQQNPVGRPHRHDAVTGLEPMTDRQTYGVERNVSRGLRACHAARLMPEKTKSAAHSPVLWIPDRLRLRGVNIRCAFGPD